MATSTGRNRCVTCDKDKATMRCGGCLQDFCFNHVASHRQELNKQLDEIEVSRDLFRQTLTQQTTHPQKHLLVEEINQWERESIDTIRQTAEQARQTLLPHITTYIRVIEDGLSKLTEQVRHSREENDFYETDLHHWNEELTRLSIELTKSSNINLRHDTTSPFIDKIYIDITSVSVCSADINANSKWAQNGVTVAGGNKKGNGGNQLSSPYGIYVDEEQNIYVADYYNHRIMEWKKGATSGQVVAGGNGPGNRNDQLNGPTDLFVDKQRDNLIICDFGNKRVVRWPRRNGTHGESIISNISCWGLSMDNDGYVYVSDHIQHEVRRWRIGDTNGVVIAGGNGLGNRLDQLNRPTYIFFDVDGSMYVSDDNNHRVMKWMKGAKEGVVVAGGHGKGVSLVHLSNPYGLAVDQLGTVYVADYTNHRVGRWLKGAAQGSIVVGENGQGEEENQFGRPIDLCFDQQGNLYVADIDNHRVQKFNIV